MTSQVRPEILSSWRCSTAALTSEVVEAPLVDEGDTRSMWRGSALQMTVDRIEDELRRTAEDGNPVIAVTDAETRILWTYGGRVMRRKAGTVNFVAGGRSDEACVGTNALDRTHSIGLATALMMARLLETALPASSLGHGSTRPLRAGTCTPTSMGTRT